MDKRQHHRRTPRRRHHVSLKSSAISATDDIANSLNLGERAYHQAYGRTMTVDETRHMMKTALATPSEDRKVIQALVNRLLEP